MDELMDVEYTVERIRWIIQYISLPSIWISKYVDELWIKIVHLDISDW